MPVGTAILNNAMWCAAVLRAHGLESRFSKHYWSTDGAVPPYYPNLVTLTQEGTSAQLERIRALAAAPPTPTFGIKDSFARLSPMALEELGLRMLFEAHWYGIDAGEGDLSEPETDVRFAPIETPVDLDGWQRAWQLSLPAPGPNVFPPALLSDPDVTFFAALRGTELVGGVATNCSQGAIGLSNFYALHAASSAPVLRDCVRTVRRLHPDRTVVGYGSPSEREILACLGCWDLGRLRVWTTAAR